MNLAASLLAAAALIGAAAAAPTLAQPTFTDWQSVVPGAAAGDLSGMAVSLTSVPGGAIVPGDSITNNSSTLFSDPRFTPQLPFSDVIGLRGLNPAATFTLTFEFPVQDPVIHLSSYASTGAFPGINLAKLSGDATLTVSGNTVQGVTIGPPPPIYNDSNGTIQLPGTYTTITFTLLYPPGIDGIRLHVGGTVCEHMTKPPVDRRACPGEDVEFSVSGIGEPVTFQWRKDGKPIDTKENPSAATETLVLENVGLADAGSYDVYVVGPCSDLTSPPGVLTVCIADFNCDGTANSTDVSDFINQWFQDQAEGTFLTDWDDNGVVNSTDVSGFINDWFADTAGPCGS